MMNSYSGFGRIMLTIVMAMCLRIAPWPGFLSGINPDWVLLVLIYWTIAVPERIGIFHAWTVGLLTDVLTGRVFGQYALAFAPISITSTGLVYFLLPAVFPNTAFLVKKHSTPRSTAYFFLAACFYRYAMLAPDLYSTAPRPFVASQ